MNNTENIMNAVKCIEEKEEEGLLGFVISENIENYEETGASVLALLKSHPEQATLLNDMLVAICGWSLDSLLKEMDDRRKYYLTL